MSSPSSVDEALPPAASLAIHLDLVGGIAGDMFVAAMLDAIPSLAPAVLSELAKVRPIGAGAPALTATTQAGLRAARFGLASNAKSARSSLRLPSAVPQGRSYASLRSRLAAPALEEGTKREALALLALLGQAESTVHGIAVDAVHFHELADWDSLLDVVATGCIVSKLRGAQWTASAVPLGGGTVRTAHGVLPVPAPATAQLLVGFPCRDDGVGGERVTPIGAAILRHLVPPSSYARPLSAGRLIAVGTGAGTKVLSGVANITRALVFERVAAHADHSIATIEFDVDDMTGEEIAHAADRLRAAEGVLDVSVGTRLGKKGRPLSDFRLLLNGAAVETVVRTCFAETSTLGLRLAEAKRHVLRREEIATAVGSAAVGVKIARRPDGTRTAKAEHDDVVAQPTLAQRRRVRAAAERGAVDDE